MILHLDEDHKESLLKMEESELNVKIVEFRAQQFNGKLPTEYINFLKEKKIGTLKFDFPNQRFLDQLRNLEKKITKLDCSVFNVFDIRKLKTTEAEIYYDYYPYVLRIHHEINIGKITCYQCDLNRVCELLSKNSSYEFQTLHLRSNCGKQVDFFSNLIKRNKRLHLLSLYLKEGNVNMLELIVNIIIKSSSIQKTKIDIQCDEKNIVQINEYLDNNQTLEKIQNSQKLITISTLKF